MDTNGNSAREEFLKKYRTLNEPNKLTWHELDTISNSIERNKIKGKEIKKKIKINQTKAARRKFVGRIVAGILSGVALVSGINMAQTYIENNQPATIDQVLENGASLEDLGIDNEIVSRIDELESTLEREDFTDQEVKGLAIKINDLQFDVTEEKLAKVTGEDNISLGSQYLGNSKTRNTVETTNTTYVDKDMITNVNTISPEISSQITSIRNMQKLMIDLQNGKFTKEDVLNKYRKALEGTSQFAGMKLQMDGKGNITVQKTRVADLSQEKRENIYNQAAKEVLSKDVDDELEL